MSDFTCTLIRGTWYCPHDCDDPSHGHAGLPKVFYRGRYYASGALIETIINN